MNFKPLEEYYNDIEGDGFILVQTPWEKNNLIMIGA